MLNRIFYGLVKIIHFVYYKMSGNNKKTLGNKAYIVWKEVAWNDYAW